MLSLNKNIVWPTGPSSKMCNIKNATIQNFIYVAVLQLVRKQNVEFLSQLQQNASSSNT